ncbi:MAG: hypothetical protein ACFFB5_15295 [Promethearchaeota archaeon]
MFSYRSFQNRPLLTNIAFDSFLLLAPIRLKELEQRPRPYAYLVQPKIQDNDQISFETTP